jgi:hypothetical protein
MTFTSTNGDTIKVISVNPDSGRITYVWTRADGHTVTFCHGATKFAKITRRMTRA